MCLAATTMLYRLSFDSKKAVVSPATPALFRSISQKSIVDFSEGSIPDNNDVLLRHGDISGSCGAQRQMFSDKTNALTPVTLLEPEARFIEQSFLRLTNWSVNDTRSGIAQLGNLTNPGIERWLTWD